jgi:acetate---CoA ligase (ADP-forming) subunit alpha
MEKGEIKNFFNPKVIAIIGASENNLKVGGILLEKVLKSRIKVVPINPNHDKIMGVKCYKNIRDYAGKVDLAIIAIPSLFVIGALNECGRKGIKNVIVISAGFAEIGNVKGEKELVETAKKYGIRFMGPNCFGICNPFKKLDTTFSASMPKKGKIAFISQSGALWSYISDFAVDKNMGFSGFASLGNMADLEFADFIEYFSKNRETRAIVLYVEKLKDGKRFMKACRSCKKPIYAIKAGSSLAGEKAAVSHTASLASDYAIYRSVFKQSKVTLCESLIEAFEKIQGKALIKPAAESVKIGKKLFVLTNAGGAGALVSDYLSNKGFELARQPLDILGTATGSDYFNALDKIKKEDFYDSVVVVLTPQSMSEIKKTAEVIDEFKEVTGKTIVALFLGGKSMKEANNIFEKAGIPYFNTLEEARTGLVY